MTVESQILAVSAAWDAALLSNEAAAFAEFATDDWVYVGPDGATPKADVVGWIASGRLAHHTMRSVGVPRIAVHGDTAIMTARKTSTGSWDGITYSADEWISEVYVRRDGQWRCVFSQKCPTGLDM